MNDDAPRWHVARDKLTEYLLNDDHTTGRYKAAVLASFGFRATDPSELEAALLDHPVRNAVARTQSTTYGTKLEVRCTMRTPDGRDPCMVSVWLQKSDGLARLVTAYPGSERPPS